MVLLVFAKGTLRGNPDLWLRQVVDRRGHVTSRWKRLYDKPSPRVPSSTAANIQRGKAAMAHVILHQATARYAMHRTDLGWIDFVWGSEGAPASKSGRRKGAYGVAHILEARQRKDRMTASDAKRMALFLPEVMARGGVARSDQIGGQSRLVLAFGGYEAILVKPKKAHAWLLSGWQKEAPVA